MKHANKDDKSIKKIAPVVTKGLSTIIAAGLLTSVGTAYGAVNNGDGTITVERGDTLSKIAEEFGGSYHEYTGYSSGNPHLIFPGETVTRTVKEDHQKVSDAELEDYANRVWQGEFGNDPDRHSALAELIGEDGANAVQDIVNRMAGIGTATITDENREAVTETVTKQVEERADHVIIQQTTVPNTNPTVNNTNTAPSNGKHRVWVVDVAGHYEMVTVDEDMYETQTIPAVTEQRLKTPAWTEVVHHPETTETIKELVTPYWEEQVKVHDEWSEEVHHPEVTETKTRVVTPAWEEQVKVKDAWTETVHHPAVTETQKKEIVPAWEETVKTKDAWVETVEHPAETKEVTIPAVTHTETVILVPEHEEQREVKPAWDETVVVTPEQTVEHPAITHEEPVYEEQLESMGRWDDGYTIHMTDYYNMSGDEREAFCDIHGYHYTTWDEWQQVQVGTQTIVDTPAWTETIPAVTQTITHPAEYETVTVPAVTEEVEVEDEPARTETVVVTPAYKEDIHHPAEYQTIYHDAITEDTEVEVTPAYDEEVTHPAEYETVQHDAVTEEYEEVVTPAYTETIVHPEEWKTVSHEAVYQDKEVTHPAYDETVEHPDEYETVVITPEQTITSKVGTRKVQKQGKWIPEQGHWVEA